MISERLQKLLGDYSRLRSRLEEMQERERVFLDRCDKLLQNLRAVGQMHEMEDVVETLGDLVAFRHVDGEGNEINLVLSPQRDRAIINERYVPGDTKPVRREGGDILLAIQSLAHKIDPNQCIVYQLLKPVEVFAIVYKRGKREPVSFIGSHFGIVTSRTHMLDFVQRLHEAPKSTTNVLPGREDLPDFIESRLEETVASSLEERLKAVEKLFKH